MNKFRLQFIIIGLSVVSTLLLTLLIDLQNSVFAISPLASPLRNAQSSLTTTDKKNAVFSSKRVVPQIKSEKIFLNAPAPLLQRAKNAAKAYIPLIGSTNVETKQICVGGGRMWDGDHGNPAKYGCTRVIFSSFPTYNIIQARTYSGSAGGICAGGMCAQWKMYRIGDWELIGSVYQPARIYVTAGPDVWHTNLFPENVYYSLGDGGLKIGKQAAITFKYQLRDVRVTVTGSGGGTGVSLVPSCFAELVHYLDTQESIESGTQTARCD